MIGGTPFRIQIRKEGSKQSSLVLQHAWTSSRFKRTCGSNGNFPFLGRLCSAELHDLTKVKVQDLGSPSACKVLLILERRKHGAQRKWEVGHFRALHMSRLTISLQIASKWSAGSLQRVPARQNDASKPRRLQELYGTSFPELRSMKLCATREEEQVIYQQALQGYAQYKGGQSIDVRPYNRIAIAS